MQQFRDFLVTDRAPPDVTDRNVKGTYNAADLNRVDRAVMWLKNRFWQLGYGTKPPAERVVIVSAQARPTSGGTAQGGLFYQGEEAHVSAEAAPRYQFAGWEEAGAVIGRDPDLWFQATADRDLTAVFQYTGGSQDALVGVAKIGEARVGQIGA